MSCLSIDLSICLLVFFYLSIYLSFSQMLKNLFFQIKRLGDGMTIKVSIVQFRKWNENVSCLCILENFSETLLYLNFKGRTKKEWKVWGSKQFFKFSSFYLSIVLSFYRSIHRSIHRSIYRFIVIYPSIIFLFFYLKLPFLCFFFNSKMDKMLT